MKRIILTIFTLASLFVAKAATPSEGDYDFKVQYPGQYGNPAYLYFQWVDKDAQTCRLIPANCYEVKPEIDIFQNDNAELYGYVEETTTNYTPTLSYTLEGYSNLSWPEGPQGYIVDFPIGDDGLVEYEEGKYATLVEIGDFSFCHCFQGTELKIPSTVERIGKGAFFLGSQYGDLTVDLGNVKEIDDFAFYGHNVTFTMKENGSIFPQSLTYLGSKFALNTTNTDLVIDNPELEIGDYAFVKDNHNFKTITIKQLKKIGKGAFDDCQFSQINVSGLETIEERAFASSSNATTPTVVIGDGVVNINKDAFLNRYVVDLTLGEDLEYIGKGAFFHSPGLESLTVPDSVVKIDDYAFFQCEAICPLRFGKGLEHIGAFAFYRANYNCETTIVLHSKLKYVGPCAFYFIRSAEGGKTGIDWQDLYVYAVKPPTMDYDETPVVPGELSESVEGVSGFGDLNIDIIENGGFYNWDIFWCYPYVCLHVPKGSYWAYKKHPEWGKFQCIIEDLVPEDTFTKDEDGSIQKHVGYVFLSLEPNVSSDDYKSYPLSKDLFSSSNFVSKAALNVDTWEIYDPDEDSSNNNVVLIEPEVEGPDGWMVQPQHYGQQLILGYNTEDNRSWNGNDWVKEKTLVGAIMVFVCPTVTLVYDETPTGAKAAAPHKINTLDESGNAESTSADYDDVVSSSSSYQHRAIYNSYPKFGLTAPAGITIETIEKGHFDEDGGYTNGYDHLVGVEDDQLVGEGSDTSNNGGYIVPLNAITENRVIKLSSGTAENYQTTGVQTVKIDDTISVTTNGLMLTINGADENAVVRVYDTKGILLKETTEKSILLPNAGIYVLTVEGVSFKAMVR